MNYWQYLMELNKWCQFTSREGRGGKASNSELKRILKNQAMSVNGVKVKWDEEVIFPIKSLTLFTKHNKITIL